MHDGILVEGRQCTALMAFDFFLCFHKSASTEGGYAHAFNRGKREKLVPRLMVVGGFYVRLRAMPNYILGKIGVGVDTVNRTQQQFGVFRPSIAERTRKPAPPHTPK